MQSQEELGRAEEQVPPRSAVYEYAYIYGYIERYMYREIYRQIDR